MKERMNITDKANLDIDRECKFENQNKMQRDLYEVRSERIYLGH